MPYIIALTGGICAGKSIVSKKFSDLFGINIIDADVISKNITKPGSAAIQLINSYFGPSVLHSDGSLNRHYLKKRIFSNPIEKKWIETLLHPLIRKETKKKIMYSAYSKSPYIIWVVPLLIENNLQKYADRILVVDTSPNIQFNRILYRDNINHKIAEKILLAQTSQKLRLKCADDIIDNNSSLKNILQKIKKLHQIYLSKCNLNN